ncbi:MAG: CoA transferase [Candidatus Tectomicrobia bacterium]|uniref:CoA transferase n=1 Tax=Tectimicrobiota bacterium TaxID=2528274 RepID=A0A932CMI5_UNCTE|nr:CoA transferase [Candidatus Tectomicrobia bacterium]
MKKEEFYREVVPNSKGPLEGIKILEATNNAAGPFSGMLMVDLGAESIKCDLPGRGDASRYLPPLVPGIPMGESSPLHLTINRNMKNITLDFRTPKGREIFKELARRVDIVVENFKAGTMAKWGLGYEDIRAVKPDIIYTSISGFGQFGPNHYRPSYDAVGQAAGGLMAITGHPDGPPTRVGYGLGDDLAGWQGAMASLAALLYRKRTGKGQHIDISQQDPFIYCSDFGITAAANAGYVWKRMGNEVPVLSPYNAYLCQDGKYVFIGTPLQNHWERLCRRMGREDLIGDPRLDGPAMRAENRKLVNEAVSRWTATLTSEEVVAALDEEQLVVARIMDFPTIIRDPHLREREMVVEVEHPLYGQLTTYGPATKFSRTPGGVRTHAPLLGQHNEEIYGGMLGLSAEEIAGLKGEKVI